jgi:hypothetical protein
MAKSSGKRRWRFIRACPGKGVDIDLEAVIRESREVNLGPDL